MHRKSYVKAGTVLGSCRAMRLRCALGHEWDGTHEVVFRGYKSNGRHQLPVVESIFTPPACPTCGHKCMGGVPDAKGAELMAMSRYRRLNIAETKALLEKGHEITAADGERQFRSEVYKMENLHAITVHRAAWNNLLKSGYIKHIRSFGPRNEFHVWGKA